MAPVVQVRIELYLECPPLPLDTFKPLIRENMLGNTEKFQVGGPQFSCSISLFPWSLIDPAGQRREAAGALGFD